MSEPPRRERRLKPGRQFQRRNVIEVSATELRRIFAVARVLQRYQSGELTATFLYNRPASPDYNQPEGTLSQGIAYRDKDNKTVAIVHRFWCPDGTIGA